MSQKTFTLLFALALLPLFSLNAQNVDVTSIVKEANQNNAITLPINNGTLQADPAPKIPKRLKLEYKIDSTPRFIVVEERDTLELKAPAGQKLEITKATYGTFGEKVVNVTSRLAAKIENDKLSITVNNSEMGSDPSRGDAKELHVVYTVNGTLHRTNTPEENSLTLPLPGDGAGKLVILSAIYGLF